MGTKQVRLQLCAMVGLMADALCDDRVASLFGGRIVGRSDNARFPARPAPRSNCPVTDASHIVGYIIDTCNLCLLTEIKLHPKCHQTTGSLVTNSQAPITTMRLLLKAGLSGNLLCELNSADLNWDKMGDIRFMKRRSDHSLASFGTRLAATRYINGEC